MLCTYYTMSAGRTCPSWGMRSSFLRFRRNCLMRKGYNTCFAHIIPCPRGGHVPPGGCAAAFCGSAETALCAKGIIRALHILYPIINYICNCFLLLSLTSGFQSGVMVLSPYTAFLTLRFYVCLLNLQ